MRGGNGAGGSGAIGAGGITGVAGRGGAVGISGCLMRVDVVDAGRAAAGGAWRGG